MKQDVLFWSLIFLSVSFLHPVQQGLTQNNPEKTGFSVEATRPLVLNGYTQVRFQSGEDITDGFDIRRARLSLKGKLGKRLTCRLQSEFGGTSQKLLDAELAYQITGFITIHAGQFKIPFSLENLISSGELATINRSQVVEALTARSKDVPGNQNGRDVGMKVSANSKWIDFSIGVFNGSGINSTDINEKKDLVGRLVLNPFHFLSAGCSYYTGRMTLSGIPDLADRNRTGAEISWSWCGAVLCAEYIRGKDDTIEKSGWYVQAAYEILAKKLFGVLKYDVFNADLDQAETSASVITAGCTVMLDQRCKVQINYEIKSEDIKIDNNALLAQAQYGF